MNINKKSERQIIRLIIFSGIVLWAVFNYKIFIDFVSFVIKLFLPLIVGIAIAFIINVPMKQIERKVFNIDKRKHKKMIRVISLVLSIVIIFGVIGLILFLVIPELISAINMVGQTIPKDFTWFNDIANKLSDLYPSLEQYIKEIDTKSLIETSINSAGNFVTVIIGFLSSLISRIIIFFIGFILSIYILLDKENLARQCNKLMTAFVSDDVRNNVIKVVKLSNTTFTNFITGQCLDAILIATLLFIIMSLLHIPYALIIAVLFAVTALIPYIGAFIALAVGVLLIAVTNPIMSLWYVIIFFALQQLDENFTYPKIVGKSVGLPALLALLAALIGGSVFGFIGVIISIPLSSIIYALFREYVNERIKKRKLNNLTKNDL